MLKHHTAVSAGTGNRLAVQRDAPGRERQKPGDKIQQRGFSAAGRAEHHQQLAVVQRQVDIGKRGLAVETGMQMRDP